MLKGDNTRKETVIGNSQVSLGLITVLKFDLYIGHL